MLMKADPSSQLDPAAPDEGTPVSVKIRERIQAARKRFHSNDNIADFIQPGELERCSTRSRARCRACSTAWSSTRQRPQHRQHGAPRRQDVPERGVPRPLRAAAADHRVPQRRAPERADDRRPDHRALRLQPPLLPVIGKLWIGVMPNEHTNVIGLSKYARLAEWVMGRPQIQEEAVVQLADLIMEKTQPDGLALVMEASHYCMAWRGVKDMDSKMINSVMRGVFLKDPTCAANSWR
jgi:GTP cyclohydrolase I